MDGLFYHFIFGSWKREITKVSGIKVVLVSKLSPHCCWGFFFKYLWNMNEIMKYEEQIFF